MSKAKRGAVWPADKVERWGIDDLEPYDRNARVHSDEQVAQIARSIEEFGFTIPILVDEDGTIIAGHGRVMAARSLGLDEVPVMVARGWTDEQRRAYTLADNQLALNATWDDDLLRIELSDLKAEGADLSLIGFADVDLARIFATTSDGDPEHVPEPEVVAVTRPGDIWQLGEHRIICGSSTDAETVEAVLDGARPHLMVTDPPYGVEYEAGWRNKAMPAKNDPNRWKDGQGRATGAVMNDDRADWREAWALFPGDVAYVWHAGNKAHIVAESLIACGLDIRAQVIWAKSHFAIGRGDYHPHHEPCWYAVRKGKAGHWAGDRKQTTVWNIDKPAKSETGHSTQKPIECMKRPIENNSEPGDAIFEPFSGSGTTIIAGEMTGRRVYAVELNPVYVDVAVRRWEAFTGKTATLAGSGATFAATARDRAAQAA